MCCVLCVVCCVCGVRCGRCALCLNVCPCWLLWFVVRCVLVLKFVVDCLLSAVSLLRAIDAGCALFDGC